MARRRRLAGTREHAIEVAVVLAVVEADRVAARSGARPARLVVALRRVAVVPVQRVPHVPDGMLLAPRDPAPRAQPGRRARRRPSSPRRRRAVVGPARERDRRAVRGCGVMNRSTVAVASGRGSSVTASGSSRPAARGAHRIRERADLALARRGARLVDRDRERHLPGAARRASHARHAPSPAVAGSSGMTAGHVAARRRTARAARPTPRAGRSGDSSTPCARNIAMHAARGARRPARRPPLPAQPARADPRRPTRCAAAAAASPARPSSSTGSLRADPSSPRGSPASRVARRSRSRSTPDARRRRGRDQPVGIRARARLPPYIAVDGGA